MGWREFQAWLGALKRQTEPQTVGTDSWAGADSDAGWQELRRLRDESNRG